MIFGFKNVLMDVVGFMVGYVQDYDVKIGIMVVVGDVLFICGVYVMGGVLGMCEIDLLVLDKMVEQVDVLVLLGGLVFGFDVVVGVVDWLCVQGCGFQVGFYRVLIVFVVILFDLMNGGNKDWVDLLYCVFG